MLAVVSGTESREKSAINKSSLGFHHPIPDEPMKRELHNGEIMFIITIENRIFILVMTCNYSR